MSVVRLKTEEKMKAFAKAYVALRFDGKAAAAACGFGYPNSAHVMATKYLRMEKVQGYIAEAAFRALEVYDLTSEQIVMELKKIAFSNLADFIRIDECGRPTIDMASATRAQIAGLATIKVTETMVAGRSIRDPDTGEEMGVIERKTELRLWDKRAALTDLLRFVTAGGKLPSETEDVKQLIVNMVNQTTNVQNNVVVSVADTYREMLEG